MSHPSSITSSLLDWLKPPRAEALSRLRTNSVGLFTLTILVHLLPLPSFWTSVSVVQRRTPANILYYGLCALGTLAVSCRKGYCSHLATELLLMLLLSLNVVQSLYALKYPRIISRPPPSPTKPIAMSPPAAQRSTTGLSSSVS